MCFCPQAVSARLESLQQEAKALAAKAESMQRTHKAEVTRLQQDKEALTQQLQQQERTHQALVRELQRKLDAVQQQAVERQTERTSECSRLEAAQRAEVQALEGKVAKATGASDSLLALLTWEAPMVLLPFQLSASSIQRQDTFGWIDSDKLWMCCDAEQSARLTADLEEARAALELQHSVLQEQLQRLLAEKDMRLQALQEALEAQKQ